MKPIKFILPLAATSILLTGCDTLAVNRRIEEFDSALIKSSASIESYYEEINNLERTSYFDKLRFSPTEQMFENAPILPAGITGAGGVIPTRPTGLITKFSPADIEVRVSAVKALGKFGEGLAALAGSDAPQRAGKSVEEIGGSVQSISNHVGSLSGQKSSEFSKYAGPISTLGAIVTTHWLKNKQKNSVRLSIIESKECVPGLIEALKKEIGQLDESLIKQSAKQSLQYRIDYYNRVFVDKNGTPPATATAIPAPPPTPAQDQMMDDSKRKAFLAETILCADRLNKVEAVNPVDMITSLETAYNKLVKKVESKPTFLELLTKKQSREEEEEEFRDLSQSIGSFLEEANRVAEAVKKLKTISNSK